MTEMPFVSLLIFVPILAGLTLALVPSNVSKIVSGIIALATLVVSGVITSTFLTPDASFKYNTKADWITTIGASYNVGVDSMAAWMILLTAFLTVVAIAISKPSTKAGQFFGLLLCLEGTLIGVFSSLDLLLFYVFFELSLVPVALLILGWGSGDKGKVALRYLGVLFVGSLLMLVGIAILGSLAHNRFGQVSLDLATLQNLVKQGLWQDNWGLQSLAFWGFMIAFLVKSPVVPVHRWLADTYEDAPIGAVVAGVVIKVGTFGMFRFVLPLFPEACQVYAPIVMGIGVVGIIYGGIMAAIQKNPGRLMAYSTVSHVGYILVGIFSLQHYGLMGGAFQQFNHGLAAAAVFVLLAFLFERTDIRSLDQLGGLKKAMPVFASLFMVAMLTNLGLPFTSGFVGEILSLLGAFYSGSTGAFGLNVGFVAVAAGGAILSAAYMLYMYQRMFYGPAKENLQFPDLNPKEIAIAGIFSVLILLLGLAPTPILHSMEKRIIEVEAPYQFIVGPEGQAMRTVKPLRAKAALEAHP